MSDDKSITEQLIAEATRRRAERGAPEPHQMKNFLAARLNDFINEKRRKGQALQANGRLMDEVMAMLDKELQGLQGLAGPMDYKVNVSTGKRTGVLNVDIELAPTTIDFEFTFTRGDEAVGPAEFPPYDDD